MGETSYNGWPASSDKSAINVQPFGDEYGVPFPGGVKGGDVATVLGYVARNLHQRVEPIIAGWLWGYNYRANVNNPNVLSNHSSATAIDYNAPNHPNGAYGTFTSGQIREIRAILAECQGAVYWGGDYSGTPDDMHFEIDCNAATLARIAPSLAGDLPAPIPPEPEVIEMAPAVLLRDYETQWVYGIAPGWFAALTAADPVNEIQTGIDAGLFTSDEPLTLNYIQIAAMRDKLCLPDPAGVYRPDGTFV